MIELKTDCSKCAHVSVCKYAGNAEAAMSELSNTAYRDSNDADWDSMCDTNHVHVTFSCDSFTAKKENVLMR